MSQFSDEELIMAEPADPQPSRMAMMMGVAGVVLASFLILGALGYVPGLIMIYAGFDFDARPMEDRPAVEQVTHEIQMKVNDVQRTYILMTVASLVIALGVAGYLLSGAIPLLRQNDDGALARFRSACQLGLLGSGVNLLLTAIPYYQIIHELSEFDPGEGMARTMVQFIYAGQIGTAIFVGLTFLIQLSYFGVGWYWSGGEIQRRAATTQPRVTAAE
ncbi:MAG: hypothetical protein WD045_16760 [Pirellulaceae bacterium]